MSTCLCAIFSASKVVLLVVFLFQWYIVLPMVIFTLFGGAEPEPGAADKGSAAAAPAAAGK